MPEPPHAGWKTGGGGRKGRLKNKWGKWLTAYNSGYQERIGSGGRESSAHIAQIHWYTLIDIQRLYPPFQSLSMSQLLYAQVTRPGGVSNPVTGSSIWNQPQAPSWYLRACIFAHCWKWQKKIFFSSLAFTWDCRHRRSHQGREEKQKVFRTDYKRIARGGACANMTLSSLTDEIHSRRDCGSSPRKLLAKEERNALSPVCPFPSFHIHYWELWI